MLNLLYKLRGQFRIRTFEINLRFIHLIAPYDEDEYMGTASPKCIAMASLSE